MFKLFANPSLYNKFWVALSGGLGQLLIVCASTPTEPAFMVTVDEWYTVVLAFAAAIGVYQIANKK